MFGGEGTENQRKEALVGTALKHRKSRGLLGWYIFVRQETE
jgi:hypothetical protein